MAAMVTATAAVDGTDNIQSKGAPEGRTVAATVTLAETTTAMVTVTIMTPMPTTAYQQLQQGRHTQDVPCG
jgi:hypothetical protein